MPLSVQLLRRQPVPLRWGWWHVACIEEALKREGKTLNDYGYEFQQRHEFTDETDGEVFVILSGDIVEAWR